MKTKPILFNSEMVSAILEGRKTQTRRVIKLQFLDILPTPDKKSWVTLDKKGKITKDNRGSMIKCRYGVPGDRLWVRETWNCIIDDPDSGNLLWANDVKKEYRKKKYAEKTKPVYRATDNDPEYPWMPSIFMPRWASRITLEITDVRVERLKELTDDDCRAEGIRGLGGMVGEQTAILATGTKTLEEAELVTLAVNFVEIWDKLNDKRGYSWESNPWIWVIEFKVLNAS